MEGIPVSAAPWFKFYPGDYLADTQRLTQAQHGAYLLLLIEYYASGTPPPDDDEVLAAIARCSIDIWRSAIRSPCRRFFNIRDGCWFHKRVEIEISKRQNERKGRQDAAFKTNIKLGRNTVTDTVTDTVTGTHSRYQIPDTRSQIPNPEKTKPRKVVGKQKPNGEVVELPDWLPLDHWQTYLAMRTRIRKPATARAQRMLVGRLNELKELGHNPAQLLAQSELKCWLTFYEPKD